MTGEPDYDDPVVLESWCTERRDQVAEYLQEQGVNHGEIGEWPAWHLAPITSIWAIESRASPGWVGWWCICGDHPTDYISAAKTRHPRAALRVFCEQWQTIADSTQATGEPPKMRIGHVENWSELEPLLLRRIALFRELASDNSSWDYDESEFEGR